MVRFKLVMKPTNVYIPDTSALVENPDALDQLLTPGNLVVLLHQVLEELGQLQASRTKSEGVRAAARVATRKILSYRDAGVIHHHPERLLRGDAPLASFPTTAGGGVIAWEPNGLAITNGDGDNAIIQGARRIRAMGNGNGRYRVVLISEDSNMLLRCDALGLAAEPLRYGKLELKSPADVFDGVIELKVPEALIDAFIDTGAPRERSLPLDALPDLPPSRCGTSGLVLRGGEREVLARVDLERNARASCASPSTGTANAPRGHRARCSASPPPILARSWGSSSCSIPRCSSSCSTARPARARPG